MKPYYQDAHGLTLYHGDALEVLRDLPDCSVQCCVTSPPYFGLRDYQVKGQIGLETTISEYIEKLVRIFSELRRVLRDDGTIWVNMGDAYNAGTRMDRRTRRDGFGDGKHGYWNNPHISKRVQADNLKPKDMLGLPWRLVFALQDAGWYLRMDIVWAKNAPMPESVTDRPTRAHEYIFLLSKSKTYFYDYVAIMEPTVGSAHSRGNGVNPKAALWQKPDRLEAAAGRLRNRHQRVIDEPVNGKQPKPRQNESFSAAVKGLVEKRNARSVWTISSEPYADAHFATFPTEIPARAIMAGTSEYGCCAACGAPWKRVVARTAMVIDRSNRTHEFGRTRSSGTMLEPPTATTVGWERTCKCPAGDGGYYERSPCVVVDIFSGAGTSGLVAFRKSRNFIGIELNQDYCDMSIRRWKKAQPTLLFNEISPARDPTLPSSTQKRGSPHVRLDGEGVGNDENAKSESGEISAAAGHATNMGTNRRRAKRTL